MAEVWFGDMVAEARAMHKMKKANAISEETAKKPDEIGVHKSYLDKLVKLGRLKKTEDGRYYLPCEDEK